MKLLHLGEGKSILMHMSISSSILTTCNKLFCNEAFNLLLIISIVRTDDMSALKPMPPYGILEPSRQYEDGSAREDGGQYDDR